MYIDVYTKGIDKTSNNGESLLRKIIFDQMIQPESIKQLSLIDTKNMQYRSDTTKGIKKISDSKTTLKQKTFVRDSV